MQSVMRNIGELLMVLKQLLQGAKCHHLIPLVIRENMFECGENNTFRFRNANNDYCLDYNRRELNHPAIAESNTICAHPNRLKIKVHAPS